MTPEQLDNWFSHHPPSSDGLTKYNHIRAAALNFAQVLNELCPESADKTCAIRHIRDAMMTANSSIACGGK